MSSTDPVQDIIAAGVLVVALLSYLQTRRSGRIEKQTNAIVDKVDTVHSLVNNQLDQVMDKNVSLTEQLRVAKTQPAEEAP